MKAALGIAGKDLTQAAIRFGLMNEKVSAVLVGFSNTTHIDEAVACSGMPALSDEQMGEDEDSSGRRILICRTASLAEGSCRWHFFFTPTMSIR